MSSPSKSIQARVTSRAELKGRDKAMKWYEPKPEKPKRCSRCRQGYRVVRTLCGFCYANDVRRFEERSSRSRLVVR